MNSYRSSFSNGQAQALTPGDIGRLMQHVAKVALDRHCTPSQAVEMLCKPIASDEIAPAETFHLGSMVERIRRIRLRRNEMLGAPLFRDPAWDMLLDLFAAHHRQQRVSVSSLCHASGVPATTALRHIERLESHGMVTRAGDPLDLRRCWVVATAKALDGIGTTAALLAEEVLISAGKSSNSSRSPVHFEPRAFTEQKRREESPPENERL